jgi:hypothetical protein
MHVLGREDVLDIEGALNCCLCSGLFEQTWYEGRQLGSVSYPVMLFELPQTF